MRFLITALAMKSLYKWVPSQLPENLSVLERLEREPAHWIFKYNQSSRFSYSLRPNSSRATVILFVKQGYALPEGHYYGYEDQELPLDTPIRFRPTCPFPAYQEPRQYRILLPEGNKVCIEYVRSEEPKTVLSAEIALVLYREKNANAARFLTKAKESDFDHCRVPGLDGSKMDSRSVNQIEFPIGSGLLVYVKGLTITPMDLVFLHDSSSKVSYTFLTQRNVAPIVLLVSPSQPLPPGRILGDYGTDLPRNVRLPFIPTAPIRAVKMQYRNLLKEYKCKSYFWYHESATGHHRPQAFTSREISLILNQ